LAANDTRIYQQYLLCAVKTNSLIVQEKIGKTNNDI